MERRGGKAHLGSSSPRLHDDGSESKHSLAREVRGSGRKGVRQDGVGSSAVRSRAITMATSPSTAPLRDEPAWGFRGRRRARGKRQTRGRGRRGGLRLHPTGSQGPDRVVLGGSVLDVALAKQRRSDVRIVRHCFSRAAECLIRHGRAAVHRPFRLTIRSYSSAVLFHRVCYRWPRHESGNSGYSSSSSS